MGQKTYNAHANRIQSDQQLQTKQQQKSHFVFTVLHVEYP